MPKIEKSNPSQRGPLPKNLHFTKGKISFLKIFYCGPSRTIREQVSKTKIGFTFQTKKRPHFSPNLNIVKKAASLSAKTNMNSYLGLEDVRFIYLKYFPQWLLPYLSSKIFTILKITLPPVLLRPHSKQVASIDTHFKSLMNSENQRFLLAKIIAFDILAKS